MKDVGKVEERIGGFFKREFGFGRDMAEQGAKIKREGEEAEQKGEEKVIRADVDREQLAAQEVAEDVKEAQKEERERRPKLSKSMRWLGLNYVGYEHRDDSDERIIIVYIIAGHIPVRELATFFVYDAQTDMPNMPHAELRSVTTSERFLALWFHTEYPVVMPPQVRVVRTFVNQQSQELTLRAVAPAGLSASWYWALEPPEGDEELQLVPGELLAIIFDTNEIGVVVGENAWPLTVAMRETPFTCVGYDGDHTIVNYHQVGFPGRRGEGREPPTGKLAADQPSAPASNASVPVQPFVTITVTRLNQNDEGATRVELELWFHLSISHGDDRTVFTDDLTFEALLEDGRQLRTTRVEATTPTRVQQNVYTSTVTLPAPGESQRGYYLRLRFPLDVNPVNVRGVRTSYRTLREYIDATGIRFEGYNGDDSVLAYVRAAAPR